MAKKYIDVMDTTFRDGFQSVFGGRVLMEDFFPAVEAAKDAGITHFEFGGGARFQSLFFYLRENAFDMMDRFREIVGPDANLQTLARGINTVMLDTGSRELVEMQCKNVSTNCGLFFYINICCIKWMFKTWNILLNILKI